MTNQLERLSSALSDRYRIERELGAGGMATVYLAQDLKHDRKVALKVLKPELAAVLGADRFVVEIKTTASLQHPHILPLFDSGTADGFLFYVMPFIEGETLRDKLNRETQLGVDEAVRIAREVADALDYAHRRGIIHRDIKPENILLHDGRPMVADFGIALAVSAAAGGRMTETGLSLGTPHYMSPEQATAEKEITGRSDVYSLASVLYEMLAGQPPHLGGSAQQIIMKIIAEPVAAVTTLRKSVPPNVAAALAKALEKLPADRFESATAFGHALQNAGYTFSSATAGSSTQASPHWNRVSVGLAALSTLLAIALGGTLLRRPALVPATQGLIRFALTADDSLRVESGSTRPFAISPDGESVVFRASRDSIGSRLWIRTLGDARARPIEGTLDGMNATFSPNGEWIAFISENVNVKKVRVSGGSVSPIVRSPSRTAALAWGDNDEIFLEQIGPNGGIQRVSASGGQPQLAVPVDSANQETSQRRPFFIPGTGMVVYGSTTRGGGEPTLVLYRLTDGRRQRLDLPGIGAIGFVDDRLIYSRSDGTLMAVGLDVSAMSAVGAPVALEPRVASSGTGSSVAFSAAGTLVHREAEGAGETSIALLDTSGQVRPIRGGYSVQTPLRFSPDGRRVAVGSRTETSAGGSANSPVQDVRVIDLDTQVATRLRTTGLALYLSWTADSRQLVAPARSGTSDIALMAVPLDGAAESSLVAFAARSVSSSSPLPDRRSHVLVALFEASNEAALLRVWTDGSGKVDTLVSEGRDRISPFMPRVSPDGRLVSFQERTNGDVYVMSFAGGGALQVSEMPAGFQRPVVWGPDSRRLYYGNANGLNTIVLETAPSLRVVRQSVKVGLALGQNYDLHPDGRTFIVVNPFARDGDVQVTVNWLQEARRLWAGRDP